MYGGCSWSLYTPAHRQHKNYQLLACDNRRGVASRPTNPLAVIMIAVVCVMALLAATIWLATEADIPSETAVPVMVVVLLALRFAARRKTSN
jgi:hypothetical protein